MLYSDLKDILERLDIDADYVIVKEGNILFLDYRGERKMGEHNKSEQNRSERIIGFILPNWDRELLKAVLKRTVRIHQNRMTGEKKKRKHYDNRGYLR